MDNMDNKNSAYCVKKFICKCCDYTTSRKNDYDRHISSNRHKHTEWIIKDNGLSKMDNINSAYCVKKFDCLCGKEYKYIQGLYKHKKSCNYKETVCVEIQKPRDETGDVVALLMEQNKILMEQNEKKDKQMEQVMEQVMEQNEKKDKQMEQVMEQNKLQLEKKDELNKQQVELLTNTMKDMIPKMGNNNSNNNNTNQFNINMFLNEECKDAINMSDFIKSIQVSIEQLQY